MYNLNYAPSKGNSERRMLCTFLCNMTNLFRGSISRVLHSRLSYYKLRPNLRHRVHPNLFGRYAFAKMIFPERLDKVVGRRLGRRLKYLNLASK